MVRAADQHRAPRVRAVTDEVRQRIESCTDLDTLHAWIRRSATVDRAEDLFD
ncbi:hypothetical protein [Nocardiopsis sp. CNR-923]|uniref:hypothetical protein n=1 Tax=Nocardiopsis sp. CNR-923 TaxID=1904965 RepID=UPI0013014F3C|nr:hypothetical protein [Nocardiopsis sp. CNR-923]